MLSKQQTVYAVNIYNRAIIISILVEDKERHLQHDTWKMKFCSKPSMHIQRPLPLWDFGEEKLWSCTNKLDQYGNVPYQWKK